VPGAAADAVAKPANAVLARVPSAAAPQAAPATPAVQLAHAVATLHPGANGGSQVTIQLAPAELGQLQIRITRAPDGSASVTVAAERPETLSALQGDLGHLHQALDRAGLPEQRSIFLHLAPAPSAASEAAASAPAALGASGGDAQGGFQQGARQNQPQAGRQETPATASPPQDSGPPAPAARAGRDRAGINITA
jgi:hypothetical protein